MQFLRHLFLDRSSRTSRRDPGGSSTREIENYPDALIASSGEEERQRRGGGRKEGAREDLKEDLLG